MQAGRFRIFLLAVQQTLRGQTRRLLFLFPAAPGKNGKGVFWFQKTPFFTRPDNKKTKAPKGAFCYKLF